MLGALGSQFREKQAVLGFLEFNRQFLKQLEVQEGSEDTKTVRKHDQRGMGD